MKKKYIKTIEELLALKDNDIKIYREFPEDSSFKDKESVNYYKLINGVPCWFEDETKTFSYNVTLFLSEQSHYIIDEEEQEEEPTEKETNYGNFAEPKEEKTSKRSEDVLLTALDKIEELEEQLKKVREIIEKLKGNTDDK